MKKTINTTDFLDNLDLKTARGIVLKSLDNLLTKTTIKNPLRNKIKKFKEKVLFFTGDPIDLIIFYTYFFIRHFSNLMGHKTLTRKVIDFPYYRMYPTTILENLQNGFFGELPLPLDTIMLIMLAGKGYSPKPSKLLENVFNYIPNLKLLFKEINQGDFREDIEKTYKQELLNTLDYNVKIRNYDKKNYLKIKRASYENLEKYNKKTINFYENFFGEINNQKPHIFPTSSGNESNEIVFKFLEQTFGKNNLFNQIYVFGWYYEINEKTKKYLDKLEISNYQDILPNTRIFWFEENAETTPNFNLKQKKLFEKFEIIKNIANKNPSKNYYLIWDITTRLDFDFQKLNFPKNVKIILISSLTKFQDDETNFFFGIIACYNLNKKELENLTKIYNENNYYHVSPLTQLLFPRISKTRIKQFLKTMESNKKTFIKSLGEYEKFIIYENRFSIIVPYIPILNPYKKLFIKNESFGFSYTSISSPFPLLRNKKLAIRISFGNKPDPSITTKAQKLAKHFKKFETMYKMFIE